MEFVRKHPARVYALVVAVLGLAASFGVALPQGDVLGVVGAVLALISGEAVQRFEDAKTKSALLTPSPGHVDLAD